MTIKIDRGVTPTAARPMDARPQVQSTDGRFVAIRRLSLFAGVPDETLAELAARTRSQTYAANTVVVDVGDATNDVYIITEGSVRVILRTVFGYESILDDLRPGDYFGEIAAIDGANRSANVTALTQTRLCVIPGAAFMELVLGSPQVAHRLMVELSTRLRNKDGRLIEFGALTVRQRLIAELLRLARARGGGEQVISPPPPQHILAARVATRRETVSREMTEMVRAKTISVLKGGIILHRPDLLKAEIEARLQGSIEARRTGPFATRSFDTSETASTGTNKSVPRELEKVDIEPPAIARELQPGDTLPELLLDAEVSSAAEILETSANNLLRIVEQAATSSKQRGDEIDDVLAEIRTLCTTSVLSAA